MKIYVYCRVSTPLQSDGLAAQERECRAFLNNMAGQTHWRKRFAGSLTAAGNVIANVLHETISGSVVLGKRPRGQELLAKLERGDHLCIWKLDRAFRSARDCHNTLAELKERGVSTTVCDLPDGADVTGNGIANLLIGIMASVAEWERERIRERTADQKRLAKDQGRYLGGKIPWEKTLVGGRPVDDPKKTAAVKHLRNWRTEGVSLRDCQARLTKKGFRISLDAIKRLTDHVASAEAKRRGRRPRAARRA